MSGFRIERVRVGPYRITAPLEHGPTSERWLAIHEQAHSTHVAHRFRTGGDASLASRVHQAATALRDLAHPHLLPVEACIVGPAASTWIISPFTGGHDGLITLETLRRDKGGRIPPAETERALMQILDAIEAAHEAGVLHGPLASSEILVDRRGSVLIELYGVRRWLARTTAPDAAVPQREAGEVIRDEVRSVVAIGYAMLTGLSADEPRLPASRLLDRLDRQWDRWIEDGLDPLGGYGCAAEALAALPTLRRAAEASTPAGRVRSVLRQFRQTLRPRR